ncbi:MAG: tetratricopeptide repeat protein [Verrucomicrobiae bacterium]|nr:tetratricopeptide repeat protein [Verrucomicrobiae bacterium]
MPPPTQFGGRRPDLLPNEQEVSYENTLEWLDRRKNWLIGLFGAALLAIVGVVTWRIQTAKGEAAAAAAYANARSIESLQNLVQHHAGTRVAVFAAMALADLFFQQGEWDKAAALYQEVLRDHVASPLAPAAALGLGAVEEARGNKEEALRWYRGVASNAGTYAAPQAACAVASLLERGGQLLEARQAYEDVAARFPASASRVEALSRLERLKVLLRKSAPPTSPSPSSPTVPSKK